MVDFLIPYEKDLFFQINGTHSYFTDCIMDLYSGRLIWIPIVLAMIVTIIYKRNWKEWITILLFFVILCTLCDQISANIIKPFFARPRPTCYPEIMDYVRTLYIRKVRGKVSYGFVSCHATNAFGFATLSSLLSVTSFILILLLHGL